MYKLTINHKCQTTEYTCDKLASVRQKINEHLFSDLPIASMSTVQNLMSRPERVKVCWRQNVTITKLKRTVLFIESEEEEPTIPLSEQLDKNAAKWQNARKQGWH
jgi:hypothetical protein